MGPDAPDLEYTATPGEYERSEPLEHIGDNEQPSRRIYFDLLPDMVENVLRCSSSRPNARDWSKYIPENDVWCFYELDGEFGKCMGTRFNALCASCPENGGVDLTHWREDGDEQLVINSVDIAVKILMLRGENFRTMSFGNDDGHLSFDPEIIKSIAERCTNLNTFNFISAETTQTVSWIEAFAKQVESLKIDFGISQEVTSAISLHCTHIRELTLWEMRPEHLEGVNLWKPVGKTLESLFLQSYYSVEEELRKIEEHCRKLKKIHIWGRESDGVALSKFLISYGRQLENIGIDNMPAEELEEVVRRCTSASLDVTCNGRALSETLKIGGKRFEKVSCFDSGYDDADRPDYTIPWETCPNIREIYLNVRVRPRELRAIFREPKLFLKELDCGIEDYKAMDVFAGGGVSALNRVAFWGDFPPEGAFLSLVANNKSLRDVLISIETVPDRIEDLGKRFSEITDSFMKSPAFQSLEIYSHVRDVWPEIDSPRCFEGVRELLHSRCRHRRVHVRMFGNDLS